MKIDHAYSHLIGTNVGIIVDSVGIVLATIMTPEPGQDHNIVNVVAHDGVWRQVRYMDTYRSDFVNATLT